MIAAQGALDGPRVEKASGGVRRRDGAPTAPRRGPKPRRLADPRVMADTILGFLKAAELPAPAVREVIRLLPESLRSTERALARVEPLKRDAAG